MGREFDLLNHVIEEIEANVIFILGQLLTLPQLWFLITVIVSCRDFFSDVQNFEHFSPFCS